MPLHRRNSRELRPSLRVVDSTTGYTFTPCDCVTLTGQCHECGILSYPFELRRCRPPCNCRVHSCLMYACDTWTLTSLGPGLQGPTTEEDLSALVSHVCMRHMDSHITRPRATGPYYRGGSKCTRVSCMHARHGLSHH